MNKMHEDRKQNIAETRDDKPKTEKRQLAMVVHHEIKDHHKKTFLLGVVWSRTLKKTNL